MSHLTDAADLDEIGQRWSAAMRAGDWEAAWQQTDRIEIARRARGGPRRPEELVWDGTPFTGRDVLIRCLHGLGDTLQFMRFVPRIAQQARTLHFLVQPSLVDLLRGLPGVGEVSNAWTDDPPPHEVEIEVMELAYALRITVPTLPAPLPQLAQRVAQNQRFVLPVQGDDQRVGLLWQASDWDGTRSIPPADLAPLLAIEGVRWYRLQQDAPEAEAASALARLVPLHRHTRDIQSAAAAMLEMDLVICCDGMPAHLAGSLGVPTWLLLKHEADWRWGHDAHTPWYPSVRLFRQASPGDWASVVARAVAALRGNLVSRPACG